MKTYASLHVHSDYSNIRVIDSINTIEKIIDRGFELGLSAVAITDHETVSGHVKALNYFEKARKKHPDSNMKLILGNEIYITRSGLSAETHQKGEHFYHFLLLAKDSIGHEQMRELSTRAWGRSYYKNMMRTPTFMEDLAEIIGSNPGHIIATTACMSGYTATMFMMDELEQIGVFLNNMTNIFGKDNLYIELQPSTNKDQIEYNKYMVINYWDDYNFIFTTDAHYIYKEDQEIHKLFLQSKSGGGRDIDGYYHETYLMDFESVEKLFGTYLSAPKIEMMRLNTNKIADQITSYNLNHGQIVPKIKYDREFDRTKEKEVRDLFATEDLSKYPYLQLFMAAAEGTPNGYLMSLVFRGYYDKIMDSPIELAKRLDRLNYEFEQIEETSIRIEQPLSEYFITMAKIIEIIWEKADSIVGVGRGSAVGFLVNYLIGITQIDPMIQRLYLPPWRLANVLHIRRNINRV